MRSAISLLLESVVVYWAFALSSALNQKGLRWRPAKAAWP